MLWRPYVFIFAIVTVTNSYDYCSKSLCEGSKHIGCNNTGKFWPDCPSNAVIIKFTDDLKKLTLTAHNIYRNQIASGKIKGYDKAARMATLVWNDELAKLAEYNILRCIFEHDECRNTDVFIYAGQNLGQLKNSGKFPPATNVIKSIIKGWFEEYNDANMLSINKFQHRPGKMIGHFTQLVRDQAYAVGCAIAQFKKDKWFTTLYACDYTLSNIQEYPIYDKSEKAASSCKSGKNPLFTSLCSVKEVYDNDLFYGP